MLELVQSAYDVIDQLHLSLPMLALIGFILMITLVISTRELAAWFLKINSIKRELATLNANVSDLRAQLARMQSIPQPMVAMPEIIEDKKEMAPSEQRRQFPISH